jgi:hypothetical protein
VVVLRPLLELPELELAELEPADFAEPDRPDALDEPDAACVVAACAGPGSV